MIMITNFNVTSRRKKAKDENILRTNLRIGDRFRGSIHSRYSGPFREIKFCWHVAISLNSKRTNLRFYASEKRGSGDGVTCYRYGSLGAQNEKESTPDRRVGCYSAFCKVYADQEVRVHLGERFPSGSFSKEAMTCEPARTSFGIEKA